MTIVLARGQPLTRRARRRRQIIIITIIITAIITEMEIVDDMHSMTSRRGTGAKRLRRREILGRHCVPLLRHSVQ